MPHLRMPQALPGHHAPAVGFEVPLEMLAACHGRVQHQCDTLLRLRAHLRSHSTDRLAQEAAAAVIRYFDTAARHHHEDEEQDLFPALLAATSPHDALRLGELVSALRADHRQLEQRWATLRARLLPLAAGQPGTLDEADVPGFAQAYARHIEREEAVLLPASAQLLTPAELDRIGLAMRARRGLAAGVAPDA